MFIVSTTADSGSGSLREALAAAPDDTTILITATGTIVLDTTPLQCTRNITIQGIAADALCLDAQHTGRIFEIAPGIHVRLQGMTLCNGSAEQGGAILNAGELHLQDCVLHSHTAGHGGAIATSGTLRMHDCVLHSNQSSDPQGGGGAISTTAESTTVIAQCNLHANTSSGYGGAIHNHGDLHLHHTRLHHNTAQHSGGAIRHTSGSLQLEQCVLEANEASAGGALWQQPGSHTHLSECLLQGNHAQRQPGSAWAHPNGGAIWNNGGTLEIHASTFVANTAARNSGAIHSRDFHHPAKLVLSNSTFTENRAGRSGGALSNYGTTEITTSTLVNNSAQQSGGGLVNGARATLRLFGTILAENHAANGANAVGRLTSQGYNLFDTTAGYTLRGDTHTNRIGTPALGTLTDNGGSTPTLAPLPTSPAINAIPPTVRPPKTDQCGRHRPTSYGWCIGAVQVEPTEATFYTSQPIPPSASPPKLAPIRSAPATPMGLPYLLETPIDKLTAELQRAMDQNALRLVYQPIVHIHSGQPFAYAALLRWEHPRWGILLPDAIMALAAQCGMARRVDHWVMREVVQRAAAWQLTGGAPLLTFHVSPASLSNDDIIQELDLLFATHNVPGSQFLIEVSAPLLAASANLDSITAVLAGIHSLLCGVALDRVNGTTPLAMMRQLPLDMLLLDRSCVSTMHSDLNAAPVIQTLIGFAHSQGINPVITGIEQESQLEWIITLGGEYAQGHLYAHPQPAGALHIDADMLYVPATVPEQRLTDVLGGASIVAVPAPPAVPPQAAGAQPYPATLSDSDAVQIGYQHEIEQAARYLDHNLSVLIVCDKALVERLAHHIITHSTKAAVLADDPVTLDEDDAGNREALADLINKIKPEQVLVLHHLDLVVDNRPDWPLINTARTLVSLFYRKQRHPPTLLAFADPSLHIPHVLRERFTVHLELGGIRREKIPYLVTEAERNLFDRFQPGALFKHTADMNVLQFRTAMRFLASETRTPTHSSRLFQELQPFRHESRTLIEVPDVTFAEIGGYVEVKQQVFEAIELITGRPVPYNADGSPVDTLRLADAPSETPDQRDLRRKLAPRGLLFYGPPGTGKTLFAKAIANVMQATFQLVSGPEIMSKWIGESEGNLRQIFATARRHAPAVILFDEFDSIAGKRSGFNDSGSREMNAVVSQLLTELDGFQGDQEILVIGTTNRLDMIDKALLRPSRLQPIPIGLPDRDARRQIAAIHLHSFQVELPGEELLDVLAERTEGFSGDEVRAVIQGVARRARRGEPVDRETFYTQLARVQRYHRDHHRLRLDNEDMVH